MRIESNLVNDLRIFLMTILLIGGFAKMSVAQVMHYSIPEIDNLDKKSQSLFEDLVETDSVSLIRTLTKKVAELRGQGYLLANIDKISYAEDSTLEIDLYVGSIYEWASFSVQGLPEEFENKLNRRSGRKARGTYRKDEVRDLFMAIITFSENHGYPFASMKFDQIAFHQSTLSAVVHYDPGPYITFDSLDLTGDGVVKSRFIQAFLHILPGKPFDQRLIDAIPKKLKALHYLQSEETDHLSFQNEQCQVHLSLQRKRSNRFDGIIGFLPNEREGDKLLITGKVDIELNNLFKSGKSLEFHWDRIQVETQSLRVNYNHPNIFSSPVGFDANLHLYRQDTSFNNLSAILGVDYFTTNMDKIALYARWKSSRLISTSMYENVQKLPDLADYNVNYLGIRYSKGLPQGTNGPISSWSADLRTEFGQKTILKNVNLNDELYDSLDLEIIQFTGNASVSGLAPIRGNIFGYGRIMGGAMISDRLFLNELYRLGGLNSIRGFNEYYFYASEYVIGTLEVRAYFNNLSNLFLFYDLAYLGYNLTDLSYSDTPFGFGGGINLESGNGNFVLVYALGRSQDQPIDLRFSKIHFGYVATF